MSHMDSTSAGQPFRPADLWVHVIAGAETEHDVVMAVREYLALWTPEELARLPTACRPGRIVDADDVTDLAYRLSRAHLDFAGPRADRLMLERMMSFVGHAGAQASRICARQKANDALNS